MTARRMTRGTHETSSPPAKREPDARTLVFVYGTLLSGETNHHLLARALMVGPARTQPRFSLYDLGSFPGLVPNGGHAIVGEVYEVDEPTLATLDRLEGHPDFYRRASVVLDDGASVQVYLLTLDQVRGRPIIASGSWRNR